MAMQGEGLGGLLRHLMGRSKARACPSDTPGIRCSLDKKAGVMGSRDDSSYRLPEEMPRTEPIPKQKVAFWLVPLSVVGGIVLACILIPPLTLLRERIGARGMLCISAVTGVTAFMLVVAEKLRSRFRATAAQHEHGGTAESPLGGSDPTDVVD